MISYLNDHPTTDEILALVHEVKPRFTLHTQVDEDDFNSSFHELQTDYLGQAEKAPSDYLDNVRLASEMMKNMKKVN